MIFNELVDDMGRLLIMYRIKYEKFHIHDDIFRIGYSLDQSASKKANIWVTVVNQLLSDTSISIS